MSNTGFTGLHFVEARFSLVADGDIVVLVPAPESFPSLASGETGSVITTAFAGTAAIGCGEDEVAVPVERLIPYVATDTWVFETDAGQRVEATATGEFTLRYEDASCVPPVDDPPDFTG